MGNVHTEVDRMQLTTEQLTAWKRDGTLVVPNVFSEEATAPALEAIERNAYDGLTYAAISSKMGPAARGTEKCL